MTVAVRYFVSYLYLRAVFSEIKMFKMSSVQTFYSVTVQFVTQEIYHLLCVPRPVSVSVGSFSAVLVSQFHVQTQLPHQHLAVTTHKQKSVGYFFKP